MIDKQYRWWYKLLIDAGAAILIGTCMIIGLSFFLGIGIITYIVKTFRKIINA